MTGVTLFASLRTTLLRWTKHVPALFRHDPLFRYATISAVLALFFLIARVAQDIAGPGAIPPTEQTSSQGSAGSGRVDGNDDVPDGAPASGEEPPVPGSATTLPDQEVASPPAITPGRPLENLEVEPPPKDSFGTLPQGEPKP